MRRIAALLFVFSLVCCFTRPMFAQEGSATLTGFIQDSSKAVIPGVKVTAINTNTNQRFVATAGKDGSYTIVSLPVGPYQMQIEKPGFKTILKDDLFLHTQDALEVNFQMAIGSTSETVTVNGAATNDSPAVSMVVTQAEIENIPLNGRSFQDLIALAPGTVSSAQGNGMFSIDGQRDDANNFTVDGVAANLNVGNLGSNTQTQQAAGVYPSYTALGTTQALISVDAMQEFRIQTSGYTAEYGRQPGGQIEITSRSGTDQYHGTAFNYLRNTIFDANNWFSNNANIPRLTEHQNDFGGTLGGPISIPKLYERKDKTFFFFSYEGLRLLIPSVVTGYDVPTTAFRQSASPAVQPYLNALPIPNGPANADGITAQFNGGSSPPSDINSTSIRIDHSLSSKYRVFVRVADTPSFAENLTYLDGAANQISVNQLAITAGASAVFNSNLLNELRFNYTRSNGHNRTVPYEFGGGTEFPLDLLVPKQYASLPGGYYSGGGISVRGTSLYSSYSYQDYPTFQQQLQLVDSLSWTHNAHSFKFGIDYRRLTPTIGEGQYETFFNLNTLSEIETGVSQYLYTQTGIAARPVFGNLSLYAQDHWKLSHRLTVDYGVRWELNPPPGATDGLYPPALTSSNLSNAALAPSGTPLYNTSYVNFAPRLGFAWGVTSPASHPIVLRGGTGVFYDTGQALGSQAYLSNSPPYLSYVAFNNVTMPFSSADLTPPALNTSASTLTPPYNYLYGLYDPNIKLPYTVPWNVSLDGGLSAKNTITLSYVGNIGRRLLFNQNGIPNNPLFAGYQNDVAINASSSSYNALQLQDRGDIVPHLQFIGSYTYSHSIDNSSSDNISTAQNNQGSGPVRGNSDNDMRHIVNFSINYDLPVSTSKRPASVLVQGWSFGEKFSAQQGYPLFVVQNYWSPNPYQTFYVLPNLVGGAPLYLHNVSTAPGGWEINPAALSNVALNPDGSPILQGNLPRNYFRAPGFWTMNSALQKSTELTDRLKLLFRAEAFNVFNHPSFGDVVTQEFYSSFGTATATQTIGVANPLYASGAPRSLQFMLKLQF